MRKRRIEEKAKGNRLYEKDLWKRKNGTLHDIHSSLAESSSRVTVRE